MKTPNYLKLLIPAILVLALLIPVSTGYTTEVLVRRYSTDGLTPINETTVTYQWLESNKPVMGDGNTYYYYQGPVFEDEWEEEYSPSLFPEYRTNWPGGTLPSWWDSEEIWDRYYNSSTETYDLNERVNWDGKNLGKLKGTSVKDICDLVGGAVSGKTIKVIAADGLPVELPSDYILTPDEHLGSYVLTWWSVGAGEGGEDTSGYTGPDYTNGMRTTFFADDSRNPSGAHVAGLNDMYNALPSEYYYYYVDNYHQYPSLGGYTAKWVNRVFVFSNDPVPLPVADFKGMILRGGITNGDFESNTLSGWTVINDVSTSSAFKVGSYSCKLNGISGNPASISQSIDLTNVDIISYWVTRFAGQGYFEVLVDDDVLLNSTTALVTSYETINVTSYSGYHTLTFRATYAPPVGTSKTVYVDNIRDFGSGTTGYAPLLIQFQDLSTKMENPASRSWKWDFNNDGSTDSTQQNPLYTYNSPGVYTVKLNATNIAGSDIEIKTGYITVYAAPTIDIDTTGGMTNWPFDLGTNENTTAVDLSVSTTASSWHVSVKDARDDGKPSGTDGKMAEYNGSAYVTDGEVLSNALLVKCGTGSYVTLSDEDETIQTGTASGTFDYDIGLKQEIEAGDPALTSPNVYRIVVTFTGATD